MQKSRIHNEIALTLCMLLLLSFAPPIYINTTNAMRSNQEQIAEKMANPNPPAMLTWTTEQIDVFVNGTEYTTVKVRGSSYIDGYGLLRVSSSATIPTELLVELQTENKTYMEAENVRIGGYDGPLQKYVWDSRVFVKAPGNQSCRIKYDYPDNRETYYPPDETNRFYILPDQDYPCPSTTTLIIHIDESTLQNIEMGNEILNDLLSICLAGAALGAVLPEPVISKVSAAALAIAAFILQVWKFVVESYIKDVVETERDDGWAYLGMHTYKFFWLTVYDFTLAFGALRDWPMHMAFFWYNFNVVDWRPYSFLDMGGCPIINDWNGSAFESDNNLLPFSETPGTKVDMMDYYRLMKTETSVSHCTEEDVYPLVLSQNIEDNDFCQFDQVQLLAVDHPKNVEVGVDYNGNIYTYSNPLLPSLAIDNEGNDVTSLINATDDNQSFLGKKGDWVTANYSKIDTTNGVRLVMIADLTYRIKPARMSIHVQIDKDGRWIEIADTLPREKWEVLIVDLSKYSHYATNDEMHIRLFFTDQHAVDFMGLDASEQRAVKVQKAELVSAFHLKEGDVTEALAKSDNVRAELLPGKEIGLIFTATPKREEDVRTFIFVSEGYYTKKRSENAGMIYLSGTFAVFAITAVVTTIAFRKRRDFRGRPGTFRNFLLSNSKANQPKLFITPRGLEVYER